MTDGKDKCRNVKNKMFFYLITRENVTKNITKIYHLIILYIKRKVKKILFYLFRFLDYQISYYEV